MTDQLPSAGLQANAPAIGSFSVIPKEEPRISSSKGLDTMMPKLGDMNTNGTAKTIGQQSANSSKSITINQGDSLEKLALTYHTSVDQLMRENSWIKNPDDIAAGRTLRLPANAIVQSESAAPFEDRWKKLERMNDPENPGIVVQPGDSLYKLAKKWDTSVEVLKDINGLDSDVIKAGQVINVPASIYAAKYSAEAPTAKLDPVDDAKQTVGKGAVQSADQVDKTGAVQAPDKAGVDLTGLKNVSDGITPDAGVIAAVSVVGNTKMVFAVLPPVSAMAETINGAAEEGLMARSTWFLNVVDLKTGEASIFTGNFANGDIEQGLPLKAFAPSEVTLPSGRKRETLVFTNARYGVNDLGDDSPTRALSLNSGFGLSATKDQRDATRPILKNYAEKVFGSVGNQLPNVPGGGLAKLLASKLGGKAAAQAAKELIGNSSSIFIGAAYRQEVNLTNSRQVGVEGNALKYLEEPVREATMRAMAPGIQYAANLMGLGDSADQGAATVGKGDAARKPITISKELEKNQSDSFRVAVQAGSLTPELTRQALPFRLSEGQGLLGDKYVVELNVPDGGNFVDLKPLPYVKNGSGLDNLSPYDVLPQWYASSEELKALRKQGVLSAAGLVGGAAAGTVGALAGPVSAVEAATVGGVEAYLLADSFYEDIADFGSSFMDVVHKNSGLQTLQHKAALSEYLQKTEDAFAARFDGVWGKMDMGQTMALYPEAERVALYRAYLKSFIQ